MSSTMRLPHRCTGFPAPTIITRNPAPCSFCRRFVFRRSCCPPRTIRSCPTTFFGVQPRLDETHLAHRVWPLGLGAFLVISGALVYVRATAGQVTILWISSVALIGVAIAGSTWWFVRRSATTPSNDPEDDPRYRFQGHVARITEPIEPGVVSG